MRKRLRKNAHEYILETMCAWVMLCVYYAQLPWQGVVFFILRCLSKHQIYKKTDAADLSQFIYLDDNIFKLVKKENIFDL